MWKGRWKVFQWTLTLRKSGVRIQRTTKSSTRKGYHAFRPFSPSTLDFFAVILPRIYHGIFILPLGFHPRRTPSRFYRRLILRLPAGSDVLMRVVLLGRENIAVNFFLFFKHDRFDKTNFSLLESLLFFFFFLPLIKLRQRLSFDQEWRVQFETRKGSVKILQEFSFFSAMWLQLRRRRKLLNSQ